ncbi:dihydrolipoamide dehydrogenase [Rubripirellula lacrimiformis]|uniref:Dihydrolipoamide dehydrogenase n=1 Tax=Rubripirellula lacrimiformis TaxID=1930273 RepID=A0A517N6B3_9BACT|nr:FAD-dependent oxidoreductase [Rubripirellula lacrimiformis]QDT02673.1 dihydrolipoamide dehydrogenase [Rubripirellula lacrimiformis]
MNDPDQPQHPSDQADHGPTDELPTQDSASESTPDDHQIDDADDAMTLDPPGSIAVIGAGPLGIEAALYGRFMGYDVTIIEAVDVASSFRQMGDQPLPMLPDRSLSPLAISALQAQDVDSIQTLPMTYDQWIQQGLMPLLETDLLRGRLRCPATVTKIETVDVVADEPDEDISDIPPDFRLTLRSEDGEVETLDVEAVILATGNPATPDGSDGSDGSGGSGGADANGGIQLGFELPVPYLFQIGESMADQELSELTFFTGLKEIVAGYAALAGRADLDLYRPKRS